MQPLVCTWARRIHDSWPLHPKSCSFLANDSISISYEKRGGTRQKRTLLRENRANHSSLSLLKGALMSSEYLTANQQEQSSADRQLAQMLVELLDQFLQPILIVLDAYLDKRLVRTFVDIVSSIVQLRH